jgi:DNA-binding response OmpR family regulator
MTYKVLVVDDSKIYSQFVSSALLEAGFDVCVSDNIYISRMVLEQKPDLVLMDVEMGRTSGVTAVSAIKKTTFGSTLKIHLHSSDENNNLADLCKKCGADGFIRKSGDKKLLQASVKKILRPVAVC